MKVDNWRVWINATLLIIHNNVQFSCVCSACSITFIHTVCTLVTHTRMLRKVVWNLCSLGRATRNAPNLNIMANMRISTASAIANTKPTEMATLCGSLHNYVRNKQHDHL